VIDPQEVVFVYPVVVRAMRAEMKQSVAERLEVDLGADPGEELGLGVLAVGIEGLLAHTDFVEEVAGKRNLVVHRSYLVVVLVSLLGVAVP